MHCKMGGRAKARFSIKGAASDRIVTDSGMSKIHNKWLAASYIVELKTTRASKLSCPGQQPHAGAPRWTQPFPAVDYHGCQLLLHASKVLCPSCINAVTPTPAYADGLQLLHL